MFKVSVIVPVFGVEKYIERCARSLFKQTMDDIEFIFVDDCTPDNSIEILNHIIEEFPYRKPSIKILHHEVNKGLPQARKTGLSIASGEYIIHCDSDDWIDLNLFETMYCKAVNNNLDVVCCDCKNTDGVNYTITKAGNNTDIKDCLSEMMHRKMWWSLCNKMFRKSLYHERIEFPKDGMGEDMCLCLQLFKNVDSIGYVSGVYYHYYINPTSIVNVWTPEQCLAKHRQLIRNLNIVKNCYNDILADSNISKGLTYLTFYAQEMLVPAIRCDREIWKLWRKGLKGLCIPVCLDRNALGKQRFKAFLIFLHLFPLSKN